MKGAIVTGAGSGIGRAIAKELAAGAYSVVVTDIDITKAEGVVGEIKEAGGMAHARHLDIRDEEEISDVFESIAGMIGSLSLLVNNAGVNFTYSVEDCPTEEFDACIAVNLRGHFLCSKYAIPLLKSTIGSSIIHIASTHATRTQPRYFPYNASKAAILAMTRSMALDLGKYVIRVNAICPGFIRTPIQDPANYKLDHPQMKKALAYQPLGRIGESEDIAYAVAFLASDKASFISGECLTIDGGRGVLTYSMADR